MKENDYIVTSILNPDFNNQDFKDIMDLNTKNTQLLPYQSYIQSPFITQNDAFKDSQGNFSEQKFKEFYTEKVKDFSDFNTENPLVDNFEYDFFDTSRKKDSRVKNPNFQFKTVSNPDRTLIGISGRNNIDYSELSDREKGQQSKIWDSKNKKYLDYSPNDIALVKNPIKWFKSLFEEPLVLATYNEEGDHINPVTKQKEHHQKGDLRLNDEGQYFYETLGDQSIIGKDVLSFTDILTVDGEGLNTYDFMDSDGLDKSITGTIAKTALTVAPLFLGPTSFNIYSGALVLREMSKSLPMLYGMVSSVLNIEGDSKIANTIAAYGEKFTTGTSEYSKENALTFENIANMAGDVATQYGQQRFLANSMSKLKHSDDLLIDAQKKAAAYYSLQARAIEQGAIDSTLKGSMKGLSPLQYIGDKSKWAESALGKAALKKFVEPVKEAIKRNNRLGADASLAYMAIVSNTDVYQSMLEHGASKRDAAAIAFGSTLGMFAVDKYLHLGELFFDELKNGTKLSIRAAMKKEADQVAESLLDKSLISNPTIKQNAVRNFIKKGMDFSKNVVGKYADDIKNHTTGFFGKAFGEGLEEVSEELVTDLSKNLYEIAGEFSPNFINTSGIKDVGAWDNAFERYTMSALGGFMGGGIFYGVDAIQNKNITRDTSEDDLIYLISNKKTSQILKELDNWKKEGKFGSKTLSASKYELAKDGKTRVYLTADNEEDSQNTFIYNRLKESVLQLEAILNTTGTNLSEDDLFKQMVLSEHKFMALKELLQDQSYVTKYQERFRTLTKNLIDTETALSAAYKTIDGTPNGELLKDNAGADVINNPQRLQNLKKLEDTVQDLRAQRDSFIKGEQSLKYTRKMLFSIDRFLNNAFMSMTYNDWLKSQKNKTVEELSPAEKVSFKQEYLEYKTTQQPLDLDTSFEIFENLEKVVGPHIQELSDNSHKFEENNEALKALFDEKNGVFSQYKLITWDTQLKGESKKDFDNRDIQLENESDDDFKKRQEDRVQKILDHNDKQFSDLDERIGTVIQNAGGYIDPATQRYIHKAISIRKKDELQKILDKFITEKGNIFDNNLKAILKNINPDLSNIDDIRQQMIDYIKSGYRAYLEKITPELERVTPGFIRMFEYFNDNIFEFNFDPNNITGDTVLKFFNKLADRILSLDEKTIQFLEEIYDEKDLEKLLSLDPIDLAVKLTRFEGSLVNTFYEDEDELKILEENYNATWDRIVNSAEPYNMTLYKDIEEGVNILSAEDVDNIQRIFQDLITDIEENPLIKLINNVDKSVTDTDPVTQLLKKIHIAIDPENKSIETILEQLHNRLLNLESLSSFVLSEPEEQSINDIIQLLGTVKAYLYAASANGNFNFPVGHNKIINEFANNHKDIFSNFKEFPILDSSIADMYMIAIDKYLNELSPENPLSLISISNQNKINKRQQFIDTEKAFNTAKLEFLTVANNSGVFKFVANGKSYDLLDGIEKILDENPDVKLYKIENLFYINLHKALKDGLTFGKILEESRILEDLLDISKISLQKTSELNSSINYGKLTDYDKFTYLLSISGISSNEFNLFIEKGIEDTKKQEDVNKKIVPLTIQEYTSRLALAHVKNPKIFSEALQYIKENFKNEDGSKGNLRPVLDYIVFIDGEAGVGKTTVIAKNASKYIDSDNIWLAAPKDTQLNSLKAIIGKGKEYLKEDLMTQIIDETIYNQLRSEMNNPKSATLFRKEDLPPVNETYLINFDKIKFKSVQKLPKVIIIDEITHFSGLELQILNEFAKKNNITVIGLGNTIQNGFSGTSRNIDRELVITTRSTRLSVSVRDSNLQKYENQQKIQSLLNSMVNLGESEQDNQHFQVLTKQISNLNFKVYDQDVINGDLITKNLTPKQAEKLYGEVVYVGDTEDPIYKTLQEHGKNISKLTVLKADEIQGQEFDYIVVNQNNWNLNTATNVRVYNFLTHLYTLMSRGREGSIFIDNGLSSIIGQNTPSFSKEKAPNLRDSLKYFIDSKDQFFKILNDQNLLLPQQKFDKQLQSPQTKPTTTTTNTGNSIQDLIQDGTITDIYGNFNGYEVIVADINGIKVPFYRTFKYIRGEEKGKWYPFFGFSSDTGNNIRLIKGNISDATNGYNIAQIQNVQRILNEKITQKDSLERSFETGTILNNTSELNNKIFGKDTLQFAKGSQNEKNFINDFLNNFRKEEDYDLGTDGEEESPQPTSKVDPDEEITAMVSNLDLDTDFPIRIYGSAHFSGLKRTQNGNEVTYINPKSEVKRDLQVFTSKDELDSTDIDLAVSALLKLKSTILYEDKRDLHESVSSIVDKEHLKNIKYKVVIRPYNKDLDQFVGFTGLYNDGEDGNNPQIVDGLVFTLVGEFQNNNEEQCEITLGLLANPKSYFVSEQAKNKGKEKEVQDNIDRYNNLFKQIVKRCKEENISEYDVTPNFSGLTNIRKTTGVGQRRKPVFPKTLEDYRKLHKYTIISSPYIYVGNQLSGFSPEKNDFLRGKAVVFVSNDTNLNPDDLADIYLSQKSQTLSPDSNLFNLDIKPKVRMLILDSAGISFSSLNSGNQNTLYKTSKTVSGEEFVKIFPFEEDYQGARMVSALWNYRANLKKFLDALDIFKQENGYSNEDIDRIALYSDALYAKSINESDSDIEDILNTTNATKEELEKLQKFNDSLATEVRQFRLGGSRKQSGVYLRNLTNIAKDNIFYKQYIEKGKNPVGIYLTPDIAEKQFNLIDTLLSECFGELIQLKDKDGNDFPITSNISSRDGYLNSLSGLITKSFGGALIKVKDGQTEQTIQLPDKKNFKYFTIGLQKIYRKVLKYQLDPDDYNPNPIEIIKGKQYEIDIDPLTSLLKQSFDSEELEDTSFVDMISLALHGTTADPTEPGIRATDAYFKRGIEVDPMAAEVEVKHGNQALFKKCTTNEKLLMVDVETDMPIFTVTLNQLEDSYNNKEIVKEPTIVTLTDFLKNINIKNLSKEEVNNLLQESKNKLTEDDRKELVKIINNTFKESVANKFKQQNNISDIFNSNFVIQNNKVISFKEFLEKKVKEIKKEIVSLNEDLNITQDNDNIYRIIATKNNIEYNIKIKLSINNKFTVSEITSRQIKTQETKSPEEIEKAIKSELQKFINNSINDPKYEQNIESLKEDYEPIYEIISGGQLSDYSLDNLENALEEWVTQTNYNELIVDIQTKLLEINDPSTCS